MKKDWEVVALFLLSAGFFGTPALANSNELVLSCTACEDQERAAWTSMRALVPGVERHVYVANFESEILWRFSVSGSYENSVAQVQVTSSEVAEEVEVLFRNWQRVKSVEAKYEVVIPDIGILLTRL